MAKVCSISVPKRLIVLGYSVTVVLVIFTFYAITHRPRTTALAFEKVRTNEQTTWAPCGPNHPGLCNKLAPSLDYYDMKFPTSALDEAAKAIIQQSTNMTFFHFGSGSHHEMALENVKHAIANRNFIIATTASYGEAEDYLKLITPEMPLNEHYHLLYGNAFLLHHELLPKFDHVFQFHLGEYGKNEDEEIQLVSNLARSLKLTGKMSFHRVSRAWVTKGRHLYEKVIRLDDPVPLIRTTPIHKDLLSFMVPVQHCRSDVVPAAFHHKDWGYIYQKYCREYNACTSWYLPGNRLELTGRSSIQLATKLIIVAHPDDELIFGGDDIVGDDLNDTFIVYATRDFQRDSMAQEIVEQLGLAGGVILSHADTNILETRADFRLYQDLSKIISAKVWHLIITHGETGEYGHPFHKIVHRMVSNIVYALTLDEPQLTPKSLKVFSLQAESLDDTKIKRRVELLENVYKRPSSFWNQIYTAGTVLQPFPDAFFELHNDTLCWP